MLVGIISESCLNYFNLIHFFLLDNNKISTALNFGRIGNLRSLRGIFLGERYHFSPHIFHRTHLINFLSTSFETKETMKYKVQFLT